MVETIVVMFFLCLIFFAVYEYANILTAHTVLDYAAARAARARTEAAEVLAHFSPEALRALDARFTAERLSPGGAADMLSLTFLIRGLVSSPKS